VTLSPLALLVAIRSITQEGGDVVSTSYPGSFPWLGGKDSGNEVDVVYLYSRL